MRSHTLTLLYRQALFAATKPIVEPQTMVKYRVTVDTGGTFSDFVFVKEETGGASINLG